MKKYENIIIYYGEGNAKTYAAIGNAVAAASEGKTVEVIHFFKGKNEFTANYYSRLEPEIKFFSFQRCNGDYNDLPEREKEEECENMKNGFLFAKKVMTTRSCDVLVLDEFLGLEKRNVICEDEMEAFFAAKPPSLKLILTGRHLKSPLKEAASAVYNVSEETD